MEEIPIDRDLAKTCVGKGWSHLIDKIYDKMDELKEYPLVIQVKEKFGGLRFYIGPASDELHNAIWDIEEVSNKTCEICGEAGKKQGKAWIKTMCDPCFDLWRKGKIS